ncbi:unconventional myosin-IXa isoform X2 [Folsomia candida]|uniref:unconventional myosin-IXa isoform X2 n=1 Tax=Folsomia candida TaxID=158441 RepID=UPI000B909A92|nr:unconventional myosin-IXa isoform X2 [Folsomia candida]
MEDDNARHIVRVYVGALSQEYEALSVEASKHTTAEEIVTCIVQKLGFKSAPDYELAEVIENSTGQECKERRIGPHESPVALKLLWPKTVTAADVALFSDLSSSSRNNLTQTLSTINNGMEQYRFCLREKLSDSVLWSGNFAMDPQILRDYFYRFLYQPKDKEYPDLCELPDLNSSTLLNNLKLRFNAGHIYSYVGSILIAINPFSWNFQHNAGCGIYNPKYVKLYQNRRREELPPHIFSVADVAYYSMLKTRRNQCIVISGESGSGKTESTTFLLHHLTALSQKGVHGSGVEQTILSAGPVLEAFGNAKTAHNNNSSRFGKFIQVNYRENGMVHGALVQKYLLEKSRICSQAKNERNYHVFYYLLAGANDTEKEILHLLPPHKYHYLNQSGCYTLEGVDESYEFSRLKQSMEMVGFGQDKQRKLFSVLSAVLLLGNVEFLPKKSSYHHDDTVVLKNPEVVQLISGLLRVTEETLVAALTSKRARVSGEMLVINYRMPEANAARDAMAKCLYGSLFDWIVLQVNHALLSKKDVNGCEYLGKYCTIGVLDIFGFEDFADANSFEQWCINYANEQLQYYFNQHVFKYEQLEYKNEEILWTDIEFMDNAPCLSLFESRPNGLICILDDQCSFPGATNETLLQKFNSIHKDNEFYEKPQRREAAFIIKHYAGKVKYQIGDFREKNMDGGEVSHLSGMRHDIVSVLKSSSMAFVRELVGIDPVAVFRWAIVRAFFRAYFAFNEAGNRQRVLRAKSTLNRALSTPGRRRSSNDQLIKKNRSFRPQQFLARGIKNLHSVKNLASQTATIGISNKSYNPRKQPVSVSQQFQQSLNSLMITLNQANPFFIRCIKSNSEKSPNVFDDETVQRQLRYTGMLETVRIRQAGYNVRLTFEEFVNLYRILLPTGLQSGRNEIVEFLNSLRLNHVNYQLGKTKIFFRESEKIKLDYFLHQQIMGSIVKIQRWYRVSLERRQFLRIQAAVLKIQSYVRMFLAQRLAANLRMRNLAATYIQKIWRGYNTRIWYQNLKQSCIEFQARVRGNILRQKYQHLLEKHKELQKQRDKIQASGLRVDEGDFGSGQSTDYASLSKDSSQEELENHSRFPESEESSGVHEESDDVESAFVKYGGRDDNTQRSRGQSTSVASRSEMYSSSNVLPASINPDETPVVKERSRKKMSLQSRKEKCVGMGQDVEEEFLRGQQEQGMDTNGTIWDDKNVQDRQLVTNPFQKATKHLKTLIGTNNKVKQDKHEAVLLDSESGDDSEYSHKSDYKFSRDSSKFSDHSVFAGLSTNKQHTTKAGEESSSSLSSSVLLNKNITNVDVRRKYQSEDNFRGSMSSYSSEDKVSRPVQGDKSFEPVKPRRGIGFLTSSSSSEVSSSRTLSSTNQVGLHRIKPKIKRTEASRVSSVDTIMGSSRNSKTSLSANISSSDIAQSSVDSSKAGRTMSIPNLDSSREVRRTRSVSETRPPVVSRDVVVNPCPSPYDNEYAGSAKTSNSSITTRNSHNLEKVTKYHRGDSCASCKKTMHAFFNPGVRCIQCQLMFHSKCVQNELANAFPCSNSTKSLDVNDDLFTIEKSPSTMGRRKGRKQNKNIVEKPGKFNFRMTGTSEFTDRTDQIISGVRELQLMQEFISKKIYLVKNREGEKENAVDRVFQQALKEFLENLVSTFSVACKQGDGKPLNIRYKDLIANFASIMETVCKHEGTGDDFPTTMGVNAFRGFLNEFMNSSREEKQKPSKTRKTGRKEKGGKRQRLEESITHLGHSFVTTVINIPTVCEVCSSFIMWPIERGVVCQRCKLACHKKCHPKIATDCIEGFRNNSSGGAADGAIFGVSLNSLVPDGEGIPVVVERLVTAIEFYGLRLEGLYRKSGVSSKVKELKVDIEEGKAIDWELYPVHVLTSVFKSFLRELPEPLLTFELYEEFLRAADLSQQEDRVVTIFALLKKLPKCNFDLMERLVFHLARVALYEDKNRMNANSLAIVFAPCILRTNQARQVQESLNDIARQTMCIETIILSQLKKVKETLNNIETLDSAAYSFATRLNSIRSSKMKSSVTTSTTKAVKGSSGSLSTEGSVDVKSVNESSTPESMSAEEEEEYLTRHIKNLQDEKAILTSVLPTLSRTPSSENSTDQEGDSPGGSIDDLRRDLGPSPSPRQMRAHSLQYSRYDPISESSFRLPGSSVLPSLHKNRGPNRKPPTRFVRNISSVDFGEEEDDADPTTSQDDEDKSVVSVNPSNNDEEAIMV